MHGVVSLLDSAHTRLVESLWVALENEFGQSSLYMPRIAHFSYQIAEQYQVNRLGAALEQFAQERRPFRVRTAGLIYQSGNEHRLKFRFGFEAATREKEHRHYN